MLTVYIVVNKRRNTCGLNLIPQVDESFSLWALSCLALELKARVESELGHRVLIASRKADAKMQAFLSRKGG